MNKIEEPKDVKSPLTNDKDGRFSRKGKVINKLQPFYPFFDDIFVILFSFFLVAIDFVLFAGSGNIEIFKDSFFPIPEVMLNLTFLFIMISISVLAVHKFFYVKYAIASLFAFAFTVVIYKQFSQLNQSIDLGGNSMPISIIIGFIFAFIVCWVYTNQPKMLYKIFLTLTPIILFFHVCSSVDKKDIKEFVVSSDSGGTYGNDERLIYFMLPNLAGNNQIKDWQTKSAVQTSELALDFYRRNNFKVFNNAYVETPEYFNNLIMFLNPKATKETVKDYTMKTKLLSGNWKFSNLINNNINLKNNELYDYLSYQGYGISAYKSRDIDLCRENHRLNVQRCVEKVNQPTNIYDTGLSLMSRTNILFMEWFFSLKIGNMISVYDFIASKLSISNPPQVSIMYNNLYVVNSIKFFDILFENIKEDKGKQAYFVFADIPSDMYVYDEFCQIKPKDEWLDRANLPWLTKDYTTERKEAYLQQYRCLFGKLQQFMERMKEHNLLENTKIVLAGTSNVNSFQNEQPDDFVEKFVNNNLVNMAVYNGKDNHFQVNNIICPIKNIMMQQLFNIGKCGDIKNLHEQTANTLKKHLYKMSLSENKKDSERTASFEKWYQKWKAVNAQ